MLNIALPQWIHNAWHHQYQARMHELRSATSMPMPFALIEYQQQQWNAFSTHGLPTRRDERWKYADLTSLTLREYTQTTSLDMQSLKEENDQLASIIAQHRHAAMGEHAMTLVWVNGHLVLEHSDLAELKVMSEHIIACSLTEALLQFPELIKAYWPEPFQTTRFPFASMNAALFADSFFLSIPDDCEIKRPLHILSLITRDATLAQPHQLIVLGKRSQLTIVEEYVTTNQTQSMQAMLNATTHFMVGDDATLSRTTLQNENSDTLHIAHTFIEQMQQSQVHLTHFFHRGHFSRNETIVKLNGQGATCHAAGFYQLQHDQQYLDHHLEIKHLAPRTHSEMHYKGTLQNKSSAVFNGKVFVDQHAQKVCAYQSNHNLLLSADSSVYSKPDLEIYSDDVKCKHGATVGQLDQDALFYLTARGIPEYLAMQMLLRGFANDILDRVTDPLIRKHIENTLIGD